MFKKPLILNSTLMIISGALIFNLSSMWISYLKSRELSGIVNDAEIVEASVGGAEKAKVKQVSLKDYAVIGKQNVFRPQRQEWTAPPPVPVKPKAPEVIPKDPEPLPPVPLPDPAVMGIILEEDGERIAIMQGHRREKVEISASSRRRRRRAPRQMPDRIVADRMKTYHEGDTISEAVILEIQENKVIIERDGEKIELVLGNKSSENVPTSTKRPVAQKNRSWLPPYPKGTRDERLKKFRSSRRGGAYNRRLGIKPGGDAEE